MKYDGFRAIIILDGKLVVMERRKNEKHYFVLPGGHLEGDESFSDCIKREVMEEFGIVIEPKKIIYNLVAGESVQGIFVCEYVSGTVGRTADGEEYQENRNRGDYNPTMIEIEKIKGINLVPAELKNQLLSDLEVFNAELNRPQLDLVLKME